METNASRYVLLFFFSPHYRRTTRYDEARPITAASLPTTTDPKREIRKRIVSPLKKIKSEIEKDDCRNLDEQGRPGKKKENEKERRNAGIRYRNDFRPVLVCGPRSASNRHQYGSESPFDRL